MLEIGHRVTAVIVSGFLASCTPSVSPLRSPPASVSSPDASDQAGAEQLRAALVSEVPGLVVGGADEEQRWIAAAQAALAASPHRIDRSQLLLVIDRNPAVQEMRILLARAAEPWQSLGGVKVSTGDTGRRGYFLTPTGVFLHTDAIVDWRAEGTPNAQHIRGLGVKGMRVWDFGWQHTRYGWTVGEGDIRLLLHATDPTYLEQRLGWTASKGCVRIPAAMNVFLDRYGVLDADYERAAVADGRFAALLRPDRVPTPLAGNMMVVIDSSGRS